LEDFIVRDRAKRSLMGDAARRFKGIGGNI